MVRGSDGAPPAAPPRCNLSDCRLISQLSLLLSFQTSTVRGFSFMAEPADGVDLILISSVRIAGAVIGILIKAMQAGWKGEARDPRPNPPATTSVILLIGRGAKIRVSICFRPREESEACFVWPANPTSARRPWPFSGGVCRSRWHRPRLLWWHRARRTECRGPQHH